MSRWSSIYSLLIRLVTRAECDQSVLFMEMSGLPLFKATLAEK